MEKIIKLASKYGIWIIGGIVVCMVIAYFYATQKREGFQTAANKEAPVTGDAAPYSQPELSPEMKEETCTHLINSLEQYHKHKADGKDIKGLDVAIEKFTEYKKLYNCDDA
jgi:hypothetical protein